MSDLVSFQLPPLSELLSHEAEEDGLKQKERSLAKAYCSKMTEPYLDRHNFERLRLQIFQNINKYLTAFISGWKYVAHGP